MNTRTKYRKLLGSATTAILLSGLIRPALAAPQENSGAPPEEDRPICRSRHLQDRHEELYKKNFENTPHFKTTLRDGHGCESCHGPGSAHVEGGGDVTKIVGFNSMSKQDANARCLSCHGERHEQRHFSASAHASNDVGCLDCHSPHNAKEPEHLLVRAQPGPETLTVTPAVMLCDPAGKGSFSFPTRSGPADASFSVWCRWQFKVNQRHGHC